MRKYSGILMLSLLLSCQQGGSKGGGTVVLDLELIMRHSQDIKKAKDETPKRMAKLKEQDDQLTVLAEEARKTLDSIPDKNSLAFKDKAEAFVRRRREIIGKARTATLNALSAEAEAYDKSYRQIMDAAMQIAKKHGASTVLPIRDLPKPSLSADSEEVDPHAAMRDYLGDLFQRPVVASSAEADITTEVLEELGWAR